MKKTAYVVFLFAGFALILGLIALRDVLGTKESMNDLMEEYPAINTMSEVDASVASIYCPPKVRCGGGLVTMIVLDSDSRVSIHAHLDLADSLRVDEVLAVGSRIVKRSGVIH